MLSLVTAEEEGALLLRLRGYPEAGVRIAALLKAYGTATRAFQVWEQESGRVLARLDHSYYLLPETHALPEMEAEDGLREIAAFLTMSPDFRRLTMPAEALAPLLTLLPDCTAERLPSLQLSRRAARVLTDHRTEKGPAVERFPPLGEVCRVIGPPPGGELDAWYVDLHHRIRHGCARAYLIRENGLPVSAGLVAAESGDAGLIGGIATLPGHRGRGYASAVVTAACADLACAGKSALLECRGELLPFYHSLGFEKAGETLFAETAPERI